MGRQKGSTRAEEAKDLQRRMKKNVPGITELSKVYGTYDEHQSRVNAYLSRQTSRRDSTGSSTSPLAG